MIGLVTRQVEETDRSVLRPKQRAKHTCVKGVDNVLE